LGPGTPRRDAARDGTQGRRRLDKGGASRGTVSRRDCPVVRGRRGGSPLVSPSHALPCPHGILPHGYAHHGVSPHPRRCSPTVTQCHVSPLQARASGRVILSHGSPHPLLHSRARRGGPGREEAPPPQSPRSRPASLPPLLLVLSSSSPWWQRAVLHADAEALVDSIRERAREKKVEAGETQGGDRKSAEYRETKSAFPKIGKTRFDTPPPPPLPRALPRSTPARCWRRRRA
jgi:hypothetical protein